MAKPTSETPKPTPIPEPTPEVTPKNVEAAGPTPTATPKPIEEVPIARPFGMAAPPEPQAPVVAPSGIKGILARIPILGRVFR